MRFGLESNDEYDQFGILDCEEMFMRVANVNASVWIDEEQSLKRNSQTAPSSTTVSLDIQVPREYSRIIALLDAIIAPIENTVFEGATIAVSSFLVWSETATSELFNRFRSLIIGRPVFLEDYNTTIFDSNEYDDFYMFVLIIVLGRWDAHITLDKYDCLLKTSHDGYCQISTKIEKRREAVQVRLERAKFLYVVV